MLRWEGRTCILDAFRVRHLGMGEMHSDNTKWGLFNLSSLNYPPKEKLGGEGESKQHAKAHR